MNTHCQEILNHPTLIIKHILKAKVNNKPGTCEEKNYKVH